MNSRNRSLVLRGTFEEMDAGGAVMEADSGDSQETRQEPLGAPSRLEQQVCSKWQVLPRSI